METDTPQQGGESLSIEQAAAAYAASQAKEPEGQPDPEDETDGTTTDDELQASDEDVSEETDGETGDEGQADDETDEEPESDGGRFVASNGKVKLPDGTVSTVADLIQGNLRDRDYRQKTMEAAEVRKAAEAQSAALKAREDQLTKQTEFVTDVLKRIVPEAPPASLLQSDPMAYFAQEASRKEWMEYLTALDQHNQQTAQERQAEAEKARREKGEAEWAALLEAVPELRDQKRATAFVEDVRKYGTETFKLTPEELTQLGYDHRYAVIVRDAISWRKLQANKAAVQEKVKGRPPVQKGGKRLNPAETRARNVSDAMTRLKQTGSVEDATAAFLASLNKG